MNSSCGWSVLISDVIEESMSRRKNYRVQILFQCLFWRIVLRQMWKNTNLSLNTLWDAYLRALASTAAHMAEFAAPAAPVLLVLLPRALLWREAETVERLAADLTEYHLMGVGDNRRVVYSDVNNKNVNRKFDFACKWFSTSFSLNWSMKRVITAALI